MIISPLNSIVNRMEDDDALFAFSFDILKKVAAANEDHDDKCESENDGADWFRYEVVLPGHSGRRMED
uniref:Uncharacterized protein n=1 Tax=Nelumbo nucifera TaxID=4432 RepID=A0A822XKW4_NELNU|nr:TPA_asm: hypothetical protein HUJ06_022390 [Nelumbo nucifera]